MIRILICGDRNWGDGEMIEEALKRLPKPPDVVINGGARGADSLARLKAEALGIPVLTYYAQWQTYGRAAGPIRNKQMLDQGKPTHVWAFHDDIEHSKGTKDMVTRAREARVPVVVFSHLWGPLKPEA